MNVLLWTELNWIELRKKSMERDHRYDTFGIIFPFPRKLLLYDIIDAHIIS
jgi:hypothetical protein